MKNLISRLFGRNKRTPAHAMGMPPEMLKGLITSLEKTKPIELDCEDIFARLDEYVDAVLRGDDINTMMPDMKHHLEMCRDCFQEYEILVSAIEAAG